MTGSTDLSRLRNSPWRRLAIALAVPAILIGLLAMHVLTTSGMSEPGAAHSMGVQTTGTAVALHGVNEVIAPALGSDMPAPAGDCASLCGPAHEMLGMLCVLALMVTIVLLALHLVLIRWEELRRIVPALMARAAALAPPAPPSLHVLSISRT